MTNPSDCNPGYHSFVSQRLKLNYVDWGNPEAPPLLLIHGGADHCRSWDWVARELRHDWHVIAPDLRGHGDSAWSPDAHYSISAYIYDLAQFVHQQHFEPVTIVAHSFGAMIALRYCGIYADKVRKIVAIEGLGVSLPGVVQILQQPQSAQWRYWIEERRGFSGRLPRRYASTEEACARMRTENSRLSAEQADHLTRFGVMRNEDGSYSWKYDNYTRSVFPTDLSDEHARDLFASITCPVLLCRGSESHFADPAKTGALQHFKTARLVTFENAGHWLHHDKTAEFLKTIKEFL